jgi:hypothetical protein
VGGDGLVLSGWVGGVCGWVCGCGCVASPGFDSAYLPSSSSLFFIKNKQVMAACLGMCGIVLDVTVKVRTNVQTHTQAHNPQTV